MHELPLANDDVWLPDGMRYRSMSLGHYASAGILDAATFMADDEPNAWVTSFTVNDIDIAASTAVAHGGQVVAAPWDSPVGRVAELADPAGARFYVVSQ